MLFIWVDDCNKHNLNKLRPNFRRSLVGVWYLKVRSLKFGRNCTFSRFHWFSCRFRPLNIIFEIWGMAMPYALRLQSTSQWSASWTFDREGQERKREQRSETPTWEGVSPCQPPPFGLVAQRLQNLCFQTVVWVFLGEMTFPYPLFSSIYRVFNILFTQF